MNDLTVCSNIVFKLFTPFGIAILSLSLPLLMTSINRIDNRYSSTFLVKLFIKTKTCKNFFFSLLLNTVLILFWHVLNFFAVNTAFFSVPILILGTMLLFVSLVLLLTSIYFLLRKLEQFNVPDDLLDYLIEKYNSVEPEKAQMYFVSISELLYFSIRTYNEDITVKLIDFFSSYRKSFRGKNKVVVYPEDYMDMIFNANELICLRDRKTISMYNGNVFLRALLDEGNNVGSIIAEDTYRNIWYCLIQCLEYKRYDYVMFYWVSAHRKFEEYNKTFALKGDIVLDYLVSHYTLGGLLIYLKKYELLSRIFLYQTDNASENDFLVVSFNDLLQKYITRRKDYFNTHKWNTLFVFPHSYGLNAIAVKERNLRKFFALQYLRLFTLLRFVQLDPLALPNLPSSVEEREEWRKRLEELKTDVVALKQDKELMTLFNFDIPASNKSLIDELLNKINEVKV